MSVTQRPLIEDEQGELANLNVAVGTEAMSDSYSLETASDLMSRVWATRDGCFDHYPRYCPPGCPSAGRHDAGLRQHGLCECHQCREWVGKR